MSSIKSKFVAKFYPSVDRIIGTSFLVPTYKWTSSYTLSPLNLSTRFLLFLNFLGERGGEKMSELLLFILCFVGYYFNLSVELTKFECFFIFKCGFNLLLALFKCCVDWDERSYSLINILSFLKFLIFL